MIDYLILKKWWKSFWPRKFEQGVLWLSIFMLPWQLRHTFYFASYGGNYFEYSSIHLYATDVLIIVLLILWILRRSKLQLPAKWIWQPMVLWLVWITVSSWYGLDWQNSLQQSVHYWLMFGWLLYLFNNVKDLRQIFWPFVWGVAFQAVWGIAEFVGNHDLGMQILGESPLGPNQGGVAVVGDEAHRQIRAEGLLPHPNMLGGLMVFSLIPLMQLYCGAVWKQRYWLLAIVGLVGIALVLSFSRTSWAIALVTILVMTLIAFWKKREKIIWLPFVVLVLGVGITAGWQWSNVMGRFSTESRLEQRSIEDRIGSISDWKKVIRGREFAGVGTSNYTLALIQLKPDQKVWIYKPIHNIYLLITAETGAVGLAIWLWMVVVVGWLWFKLIRQDRINLCFGLPLVGVLGAGIVDHWPISFQQGRLLFFLALALIILQSRVLLERQK
jgi:hypothetical protein